MRGRLVLAVGVPKIVGVAVVGSLEVELAEQNMRVGQKEYITRGQCREAYPRDVGTTQSVGEQRVQIVVSRFQQQDEDSM